MRRLKMIRAYNRTTHKNHVFFFVVLVKKNTDPLESEPLVRGIFTPRLEDAILHTLKMKVEEEFKKDFNSLEPLCFGSYNRDFVEVLCALTTNTIEGALLSMVVKEVVDKFNIAYRVVEFVDKNTGGYVH
jgi:hypothetical protein